MTVRAALLTRLRAAVDPVYDGKVPLDDQGRPLVQRYAVLYAAPGQRTADDLIRVAHDRYVFRWQITSVGRTAEQADWVAVRCRDAVFDEPLTATGWDLGSVEHRSSADVRRDDDIPGGDLFYAVDTYEVPATR